MGVEIPLYLAHSKTGSYVKLFSKISVPAAFCAKTLTMREMLFVLMGIISFRRSPKRPLAVRALRTNTGSTFGKRQAIMREKREMPNHNPFGPQPECTPRIRPRLSITI